MSNTKNESTPAFTSFIASLDAAIAASGVQLTKFDRKNFVGYEAANGHKLYVPRSASKMSDLETTVEIAPSTAGYVELPKPNGKIHCRYTPDVELVKKHVLPLMGQADTKLRPSKAPVRRQAVASSAPAVQDPFASVNADGTIAGMELTDEELEAATAPQG